MMKSRTLLGGGGGNKNVVLCAAKMIETHILATGNDNHLPLQDKSSITH